jgi:hypothetical protein
LSGRGVGDELIFRPLGQSSYKKKELPESLTAEMGIFEEN